MPFRKRYLYLGLAGVAVAALLAWAFAPRPIEVESAVALNARYEQGIEEDGQTRLKDRFTVSAPVAARLLRIALKEGDRVQAGEAVAVLLPVMSAMNDERSAQENAARYRAASANVVRADARIGRLQVASEEAQLELQRTERLAREGFLSAANLDTARLALAGAQRDLAVARAERDTAVHEQAQAAASLLPAGGVQRGQPLQVRSPVEGVVLKVAQASEATLPAGAALMDVGDPRRMEVVADFLTTDAVQALPGTRAVIERWGGPPLAGHVRLVEPGGFTKVSALGVEEQRVKVVADFDVPPDRYAVMGDGFRVTLRIVTRSVDQAVVIPVGAIFPLADGGTGVYRIEGARARLHPIELGGRNGSEAWVRSGLAPGDTVILYPPPTVADGRRVHIRHP